jgi:excinuclease ABC subunit B
MAALEAEMLSAAEALEFERAANLRDKILALKQGGGATSGGRTAPRNEREGESDGPRRGRGGRTRGRVPRPKRG